MHSALTYFTSYSKNQILFYLKKLNPFFISSKSNTSFTWSYMPQWLIPAQAVL